jgi:hypothetical protein
METNEKDAASPSQIKKERGGGGDREGEREGIELN